MMGLSWDALWHALIAPQQDDDGQRRAIQVELDRVEKDLAGLKTVGPWFPADRKKYVENLPEVPWPTEGHDIPYPWWPKLPPPPQTAQHTGATLLSDGITTAIVTGPKDAPEYQCISFTWQDPDERWHTVTRYDINYALVLLVNWVTHGWYCANHLGKHLVAQPPRLTPVDELAKELSLKQQWMDRAKAAIAAKEAFRQRIQHYRECLNAKSHQLDGCFILFERLHPSHSIPKVHANDRELHTRTGSVEDRRAVQQGHLCRPHRPRQGVVALARLQLL
jgi:hypothetical protein